MTGLLTIGRLFNPFQKAPSTLFIDPEPSSSLGNWFETRKQRIKLLKSCRSSIFIPKTTLKSWNFHDQNPTMLNSPVPNAVSEQELHQLRQHPKTPSVMGSLDFNMNFRRRQLLDTPGDSPTAKRACNTVRFASESVKTPNPSKVYMTPTSLFIKPLVDSRQIELLATVDDTPSGRRSELSKRCSFSGSQQKVMTDALRTPVTRRPHKPLKPLAAKPSERRRSRGDFVIYEDKQDAQDQAAIDEFCGSRVKAARPILSSVRNIPSPRKSLARPDKAQQTPTPKSLQAVVNHGQTLRLSMSISGKAHIEIEATPVSTSDQRSESGLFSKHSSDPKSNMESVLRKRPTRFNEESWASPTKRIKLSTPRLQPPPSSCISPQSLSTRNPLSPIDISTQNRINLRLNLTSKPRPHVSPLATSKSLTNALLSRHKPSPIKRVLFSRPKTRVSRVPALRTPSSGSPPSRHATRSLVSPFYDIGSSSSSSGDESDAQSKLGSLRYRHAATQNQLTESPTDEVEMKEKECIHNLLSLRTGEWM